MSENVCDVMRVVDKLDDLYLRLNTVITKTETLFTHIIPNIIRDLGECCEFYSMRYDKELNEIRVYFSFNNNKTCACIVIELKQVKDNIMMLKTHYFIQGAPCGHGILA